MKYDHHCPWIGQCVGARNHKFFLNFLQWASLFCLWVFSTLLALNVKSSPNSNFDVDPHQIVIIAFAGLFSIFATVLLATHICLIMMNQTTVESLAFQAMKDRERATLARLHPWYSFGAKRQTKRQWDAEWGRIGSEGNLWWLGSKRANWEAVMGRNVWWWFLPIGRSSGDGMTYPTNPRFDDQGRWKQRQEWPVGLR
jgi:palmitoyltransferase